LGGSFPRPTKPQHNSPLKSQYEETMRNPGSNHQPLPLFTTPTSSYIRLERQSEMPLYKQICAGLREAILSGELAEGTRLPTERALASELGVNRTTVMNAYNELRSEGLIEGHVGRGTLVKRGDIRSEDDFSEQETSSWMFGLVTGEELALGPDARVLSELTSMGERKEVISFTTGAPAPDLLPAEMLSKIVDNELLAARQSALGYCPVEGLQSLRREIAVRMRSRGVAVDFRHILILSGSTQGIGLIARLLLNRGDEVIVETPTYLGAIQAFRALGARVIGIPTDKDGMRVDLLEAILARRSPRFIYTSPTFHNPTGVVMAPERRRRLLLLARRYQVPIVEDDPYGEVYFNDQAPQPLKALDTHNNVLYLSTFSKILAPGLRVAWLVAPEQMIEYLSLHKQFFDLNTNAFGQWLVSEMLKQGYLDEHLAFLRQHYKQKRDIMLEAISKYWPSRIRINVPVGGFHLWCHLPADINARTLLREAAHEHVAFVIGEPFHVDGGGHHAIRLSYAHPSVEHIEKGIARIGIAMQRIIDRRTMRDEGEDLPIERLPMV
jgi:2-aminoadipate transaminase